MAAPPLLLLQDISLTFGGRPLLNGASLSAGTGERICLVGRNGSGKSTLLKIAAGDIEADGGTRFVQPGSTVRYLPQEPDFSGYSTVRSYVESGLAPGDDPHRASYLMRELSLTGDEDTAHLSGGEARRAALARVLAPEPDVLLLDEPTNHLDLPAIEWLEGELKSMRSALVLISHDRRFLENLSQATVWLDRGEARRMDRGFAHFEEWRDQVLEEEEKEQHKLDRKIVREEHWLRYGVTARRKRNVRRLDELHSLRQKRRDIVRPQGNVTLSAGDAEASGKRVIEVKGLSKSFGDRVIVKDLDLRILRGDRLAIVGPNGAGKTTLIKLITGALAPDAGTVQLGTNLEAVSLEQDRTSLDPETSLRDALTGGGSDQVIVNGEARHVMSWMKDFLFRPEQAGTPVGVLSGGERGRIMLARALSKPSNLMVLDEPTNDLDLETLDLLQELLASYEGTVLLVSHDRDFIDRVATSTLVFEGEGRWREYPGGYTDMARQARDARAEVKQAAEKPSRKPDNSAASAPQPTARQKRKLSFKEKHALETLPGEMDKLTGAIAALQEKMADPGFYARDPAAFDKAAGDLQAMQDKLAAAEEQWLELEMLREELEG
ncbi:MAG: ATP-binding cassette domain-containing protein [Anderseniella sp.]|nr:ATP-binding cassette domain-containing protein [Anderseniella sp.]